MMKKERLNMAGGMFCGPRPVRRASYTRGDRPADCGISLRLRGATAASAPRPYIRMRVATEA